MELSYRWTPLKRLRRRLYGWKIRRALLPGVVPVVVYNMGKVASQTMVASLEHIPGVKVFHAHMLNPENIERRRPEIERLQGRERATRNLAMWAAIHDELFAGRIEVKVVTLVREPIGRNISAFFQGLDRRTGVARAHETMSLDTLVSAFKTKFDHSIPVEWFERELVPVTGIDVYAQKFPAKTGYQRLAKMPYDLLIMRHDLPDPVKAACIGDFLGNVKTHIVRQNLAENKAYFECYRNFQNRICLSDSYVEEMLGSAYAMHFFPAEELDALRAKWIDRSSGRGKSISDRDQ